MTATNPSVKDAPMPTTNFHDLGCELGTLIALLPTKEAEGEALRNVLEGRHG